jgi:hypothetical protein
MIRTLRVDSRRHYIYSPVLAAGMNGGYKVRSGKRGPLVGGHVLRER